MKKKLLLGLSVFVGLSAYAQNEFTWLDYSFEGTMYLTLATSSDGRYCAAMQKEQAEKVVVYDAVTKEYTTIEVNAPDVMEGDLDYLTILNVSAISKEGAVLYSTTADGWNSYANIYKDGRVIKLGLPAGTVGVKAEGISEDASIISCSYTDLTSKRKPAYWQLNAVGGYDFIKLPEPDKDPFGMEPQAIDLYNISDDNTKICGRLIDWFGAHYFPIVYTKGTDGNWDYKIYGDAGFFIKEGFEMPKAPVEISYPEVSYYITADEKANYDKAYAAYSDSIELYYSSEINIYPTYPNEVDFIVKNAKEYNDHALAYNKYVDDFNNFYFAVMEAETGRSSQDIFWMSLNGRYVSGSYSIEEAGDEEGGWGPRMSRSLPKNSAVNNNRIKQSPKWGGTVYYAPFLLDTETGEFVDLIDVEKDGLVTSVTNDGSVCYVTPFYEYTRNTKIIPAGTRESMTINEWAKKFKGFDFSEKLLQSWNTTGYEENPETGMYEEIEINVTDSIVSGTATLHPSGNAISSFLYHPEKSAYMNYVVRFDSGTAVESLKSEKTEIAVYPNPARDIISLNNEAELVELYDLSGRLVFANVPLNRNVNISSLDKGTYLIRIYSAGKVSSQKIVITK